jgi:hypothetical protein
MKKSQPMPEARVHPRSHEAIRQSILALTPEESLQICKDAGIVTSDGKLSPTYKSWGKGPTMTPTYEQLVNEK